VADIEQVLGLFEAVLAGDAETLRRIDSCPSEVSICDGQFVFTLDGLRLLIDANDGDARLFRNLLYTSRLNADLRARGAEVAVFAGSGKVKSNRYYLKTT